MAVTQTNTNVIALQALANAAVLAGLMTNLQVRTQIRLAIIQRAQGNITQNYAINGRSIAYESLTVLEALELAFANRPELGDSMFISQGAEL